jgi:hypothetical protein
LHASSLGGATIRIQIHICIQHDIYRYISYMFKDLLASLLDRAAQLEASPGPSLLVSRPLGPSRRRCFGGRRGGGRIRVGFCGGVSGDSGGGGGGGVGIRGVLDSDVASGEGLGALLLGLPQGEREELPRAARHGRAGPASRSVYFRVDSHVLRCWVRASPGRRRRTWKRPLAAWIALVEMLWLLRKDPLRSWE